MTGGSLGSDGIVRYKGMFNVYDCPSVEIRDCRFGPNVGSDDAVNLAESHVVVERCTWDRAPFDGLDLDLERMSADVSRCSSARPANS